jgi:hypothetical protein
MDWLKLENGITNEEWMRCDARLQCLVAMAAHYMAWAYEYEPLVLTSLWRPSDTDSVHAHGRGADIRSRDMPDGAAEALEVWLGSVLRYSPNPLKDAIRVIVYEPHAPGGAHIHLQVPDAAEPITLAADWRERSEEALGG